MLRAGAYFPPSRNGLSWSPSAAAPGHQERLVLVMGDLHPLVATPPPLLHPLRFARPPKRGTVWIQLLSNWGTIMRDATTPPRAGEVSVGRRGDIHRRDLHPLRRYTPSATLVPLREGQLWIQLLSNWGTVMRNARRTQHATSLLVGVHRFFVSLRVTWKKNNLRHPRHLRMKNRGSSV